MDSNNSFRFLLNFMDLLYNQQKEVHSKFHNIVSNRVLWMERVMIQISLIKKADRRQTRHILKMSFSFGVLNTSEDPYLRDGMLFGKELLHIFK